MIEITVFALAPGVDESTFLETDERVRTGVLYQQPGFARATTARGENGTWVVIALWSGEPALAVTDTDLAPLMDPASVRVERFTPLD